MSTEAMILKMRYGCEFDDISRAIDAIGQYPEKITKDEYHCKISMFYNKDIVFQIFYRKARTKNGYSYYGGGMCSFNKAVSRIREKLCQLQK